MLRPIIHRWASIENSFFRSFSLGMLVEWHHGPQPAIRSQVTPLPIEVHPSTVNFTVRPRNSWQLSPSVTWKMLSQSAIMAQQKWMPPHHQKCLYVDRGGLPNPPTDSLAPDTTWSGRGIDRPRLWNQRHGPCRTFVARARATRSGPVT